MNNIHPPLNYKKPKQKNKFWQVHYLLSKKSSQIGTKMAAANVFKNLGILFHEFR